MDRERIAWLRLGAVFSDAAALAAAWVGVVWLRSSVHTGWLHELSIESHLPVAALVVPVWLVVLQLRGSYFALRRKDPGRIAGELVVSVGAALLVALALLFALKLDHVSRTVVVGFGAVSLPTLVASRWFHLWLLQTLRSGDFDPHRVLLVGEEGEAEPFEDAVQRHPEWGIAIVGRCDVDAVGRRLENAPVDEVYLTGGGLGFDTLREVARQCDELGVRLSMDANFLGLRTSRAELADFDGWSVLTFTSTPTRGAELVAKRVLDIGVAGVGLALLSPILVVMAAAIRLTDGGPAVFAQERSGLYGRTFTMFKFRTMVVDAEARLSELQSHNEADGPVFKMADDPRLTRLGRFLRRSSLDELPQLFNVLRGEMSLVGPRPPIPDEVRQYERRHLRRLAMKPGLTCIWQVSGRSNVGWDRWMELDLEYIDNWSLWLDVRLLAKTVPAVLSGEGAR